MVSPSGNGTGGGRRRSLVQIAQLVTNGLPSPDQCLHSADADVRPTMEVRVCITTATSRRSIGSFSASLTHIDWNGIADEETVTFAGSALPSLIA